MLLSITINLAASDTFPILGPLGRPVGSWFLSEVTRHDPEMGTKLHRANQLRPYTASTLLDPRGKPVPAGTWFHPGQEAWVRITSIGEELSDLCLSRLLSHFPGNVLLYKIPFHILGWSLGSVQHPWSGQSTFAELSQNTGNEFPRKVRLEFASPTSFRQNGADLPLPVPYSVFHSLFEKWNAFAPKELGIDPSWLERVDSNIVVSELCGCNTEQWRIAEGAHGVINGFKGVVGFTLLPRRLRPASFRDRDQLSQIMLTLARFALYSGVGQHTSIGLGQTRLLQNT